MSEFDPQWFEATKQIVEKLGSLVNKKSVSKLLLLYLIDEKSRERTRQTIEKLLKPYITIIESSERTWIPSPSQEEVDGEVAIGKLAQGDFETGEFKLRKSDFTRHLAIYGQTGHGKTTLLYNIISQLIEQKIPFLYFDLKRDGRALLKHHKELIVIPWRELKWNPLRAPPEMDLKSWWQLFSEVCGHSWGVYHAGVNYLLEHLDELYAGYERTGSSPTIKQLFELMQDKNEPTKKRQEYYDVMYNRIRTLTSVLGNVLDSERGLAVEDLLSLPVVIELDQLRTDEQNWLVEVMLTYIFVYRLTQSHRSEQLRHVVIVDEAQRIWDINKEWRETTREMGTPTINLFPTQFRDFGEGLILTSQEPTKVTQSVHANTLVKIVGNLGSGTDIQAAAEAMGLDEEQKEAVHKLQRGEWLVKLSDRYTEPFMIVTADHPVNKNVSNEEVKERLRTILPPLKEEPKVVQTREELPRPTEFRISKDAWMLLLDVKDHPFRGLAKRVEALKISGRRVERAKQELLALKLAEEAGIGLGRYRPTKFLVLTKRAVEFLESKGMKAKLWEHVGNVGFEHVLYQVLIKYRHIEAGDQAYIEQEIGKRRIDVLVKQGSKRIGIEIELSTALQVKEKLSALSQLQELIIITKDFQTLNQIKEELSKVSDKLRFFTASYYLQFLNKRIARNNLGNNSFQRNKLDSSSFRNKVKEGENKIG
jgi:energy-coupling factor transporter ATP-binding protein EcfA2